MTALEYPISLGYLAIDPAAGYTATHPHRGIDFAAPDGTPIVIGSTMIGVTGSTGRATAPHVHVQAGHDEWAQTVIDPAPYAGKLGTVVKVGNASEWGNYVCIKVGDVYVYYCHMSRQTVSVETIIQGGAMKPTRDEWQEIHQLSFQGDSASDTTLDFLASQPDLGAGLRWLHSGGTWQDRTKAIHEALAGPTTIDKASVITYINEYLN